MTLLTRRPAGAQNSPLQPIPDTPPAANPGWFRAFLLRIHFYAGILAGPFLLTAAVTGGLYAMSPQLEQVLYSHEMHVPATHPLPLSA